jgi:hypothetical protein
VKAWPLDVSALLERRTLSIALLEHVAAPNLSRSELGARCIHARPGSHGTAAEPTTAAAPASAFDHTGPALLDLDHIGVRASDRSRRDAGVRDGRQRERCRERHDCCE